MSPATAIDPARVIVPAENRYSQRRVVDLTDDELDENETTDLAYIQQVCEQNGLGGVTPDGLPPDEIPATGSESARIGARAVNAAALRVRAYRIERDRRAREKSARQERESRAVLADLEAGIKAAPAALAELDALAKETAVAFVRLERLARDLTLVADAKRIWQTRELVANHAQHAARILGVPAPELPASTVPLPDQQLSSYLVRVIASDPEFVGEFAFPEVVLAAVKMHAAFGALERLSADDAGTARKRRRAAVSADDRERW
jgi:hypothetical protein